MAFVTPSLASVSRRRRNDRVGVNALSSSFSSPAFSSAVFMANEDAAVSLVSPQTTFEPVMDPNALAGFASIFILSIAAVWVWANLVVPVSRTNLALSKKNGAVKEYLDELRMSDESSPKIMLENGMVAFNATTNLSIMESQDETEKKSSASSDGRDFERWLFTDWLEKPTGNAPGRQKEPALPVLKDAKWNSGDNPVLAASALIGAGVLFTSVTERIASVFQ